MKNYIIALGLLTTMNVLAEDLSFNYDPNLSIRLAAGVDELRPLEKRLTCLNDSSAVQADSAEGVVKTTFSMKVIDSYTELINELNMDTKIAASMKFGGYSASASVETKFDEYGKDTDHSFTIMIKAESLNGRRMLNDDSALKPLYENLITQGKHEEFIKRCGTHYIDSEVRKSVVVAMIKVSNLSSESKKTIEKTFKASFEDNSGSSQGSISAEHHFKKFMSKTSKLGTVSMEVFGLGGGGIKTLSGFMNNFDRDDLKAIMAGLSQYVEGFDPAKSAPVSYSAKSYELHGLVKPYQMGNYWDNLSRAYLLHAKNEFRLKQLQKIVENGTRDREFNNYYTYRWQEVSTQQQTLKVMIEACFKELKCESVPKVTEIPVMWPQDAITETSLSSSCTYSRLYDAKGSEIGQILTDVLVGIGGNINFNSYLSAISFSKSSFDEAYELLDPVVGVISMTKVPLTQSPRDTSFQRYRMSAYMDELKVPLAKNALGRIEANGANLKVLQEFYASLASADYAVQVKLWDLPDNMSSLGKLSLKNCPARK
ncbi:MAG: hypothetical protein H0V66_03885 [Bdellovibrionales bacterium]|nr:hypothetical protein [Bdellovibrionales bacterium]